MKYAIVRSVVLPILWWIDRVIFTNGSGRFYNFVERFESYAFYENGDPK